MKKRPYRSAEPPVPGKTVLFSADDFGASSVINAAVVQAHRRGLLTSAGLMATGAAFREAAQLARECPDLSVGLHLSLLQAQPVSDAARLPRLAGSLGRLPENPVRAGFQFFFQRGVRAELKRESEAQLYRFLETGLAPTHLDGHHHLHVHPAVFPIVLGLMTKYSIPALRLPREDPGIHLRIDPRRAFLHRSHSLVFRLLCRRTRENLRRHGIVFPDRFLGLLGSGRMDEPYLLKALPLLPDGITEIGLHPALRLPPELERWAPSYHYESELAALTSPRVRAGLQRHGFRLAGFRDLVRRRPHASTQRFPPVGAGLPIVPQRCERIG